MKRASLLAAAAIVLLANASALFHAWRNRSGPVESDITVTERELSQFYNYANDDDSGVALTLRFTDPQQPVYRRSNLAPWLDSKVLRELGFDTSIPASDSGASEFYQRQRARRAFVALEYDGPAWNKWKDDFQRQARPQFSLPAYSGSLNLLEASPRLVTIDVSSDAAPLRARHPDRNSVLIVPAVIRIGVQPRGVQEQILYEWIQEIPSSIHVPLPFSAGFRLQLKGRENAKYRIHVRYGALLEPWIVGVDLSPPAAP